VIEGSFFGGLRDEAPKVREGTFVGTPLYVAPEMLDGNYAGKFTDLWALGCMIYQFHVGQTPFQGLNFDQVFQKVLERNFMFPRDMENDTKDIIDKLLDYTPENRLGVSSYDELKAHPYFKGIDFTLLQNKKL
jgi:serine/threonine protein kinase